MAAAESALSLVAFVNQVSGEQATVPDAEISANFRYLFEVKIAKETIRPEQIPVHLEHLRGTHLDEKLFVVTPDASKPRGLVPFDADPRVHWTNFLTLTEAIQQVIDDPAEAVGERTSFLLRELQGLFRAEGLIDFADTVVVAARTAYGEYLRHSAYVCQPGRSFQAAVTHLGFYSDGEIKPVIARIEHIVDGVTFSEADAKAWRDGTAVGDRIAELIESSLAADRAEGQTNKVFLLSGPGAAETVQLPRSIVNNTVTASGKPWAWTLAHRYASLHKLEKGPATTSILDRS